MKILVTGGLGYIGSHTIVKLLKKNYEVICLDNLINSDLGTKKKITKIARKNFKFHNLDITNLNDLKKILKKYNKIDCIIHFASLIYVPESLEQPLKYYNNNLTSLINIIEIAKKYNSGLIFSSSSTVYGYPKKLPITEDMPLGISPSPYGKTKKIGEEILMDVAKQENLSIISLRYFNPIGAHESGLIGERPVKNPIHILPYITQTAIGIKKNLNIFGNNYKTKDGTCVRDFVHVNDVAEAHIKCIPFIKKNKKKYYKFNIGVGKGTSILELVNEFERVTGISIPFKFVKRREGDVAELWSNCNKSKKYLNWTPKYNLEKMIRSAWNWEKKLNK
ncbi:UDP-glucose 4-epimerase GalE [Candidatus Pelagibacter sp.]|nr:UDP-glucose 4-epimerase GalE [Candidatus Pelagibacter sp.]